MVKRLLLIFISVLGYFTNSQKSFLNHEYTVLPNRLTLVGSSVGGSNVAYSSSGFSVNEEPKRQLAPSPSL
uniref:Uncharacterized protein n=1 Tax=Daphnia galeata TaxID=27404 RepID=A0A8J2RAU4_9CRUS|nr:unnamed protein product [Daphnia galeata]